MNPPTVGKTYALGDADYRFGAGPLQARIRQVIRETVFDGAPWFEVIAVVKPPGTYGPGTERFLYVRAAALHKSS